MANRTLLLVISLLLLCANGKAFTPLSWPAGVSNAGPYTLVSTVTNIVAFTPNSDWASENDMASHKYNHHTRIWYGRGIIWMAFSSGATNEEDPGQQCALIWSTNKGQTWSSPPAQIVSSQSEWIGCTNNSLVTNRISMPRNFCSYGGRDYLTCAVDCRTNYYIGQALISCELHTDGSIGTPFLTATTGVYYAMDGRSIPTYDPTLGPPLLAISKIYGCWGGSYYDAGTPQSEWVGFFKTNISGDVHGYDEANTFSADGSTNNLYRTWRELSDPIVANETYLWQQMSTDGGASWPTAPVITSVPNAPSEVVVRRLIDGRFVIIGNAHKEATGHDRDPLYLAITDVNSATITNVYAIIQGVANAPTFPACDGSKAGGAQYPDCIQVGNYLYVSYSIHKESIGFSRVLIPDLPDNNNDTWTNSPSVAFNRLSVGQLNLR